MGPKEWQIIKFPGFSFCFLYLWLGAEDIDNLAMPTRVDKKAPTEAYTLCSKEQEWGHLARLKILDNNGYTSYLFIYLFISFGHSGSSLLCGFSLVVRNMGYSSLQFVEASWWLT